MRDPRSGEMETVTIYFGSRRARNTAGHAQGTRTIEENPLYDETPEVRAAMLGVFEDAGGRSPGHARAG